MSDHFDDFNILLSLARRKHKNISNWISFDRINDDARCLICNKILHKSKYLWDEELKILRIKESPIGTHGMAHLKESGLISFI